MNTQESIPLKINDIIEILIRRIWYIVIPLIGGTLLSVGVFFYLPKTYKSTTVIMVEKQKVPEDFVKSSVTSGVGDQLATIRQQILRRELLETVISEFNLYSKDPGLKSPEELTDLMREKIEIQVDKGGRTIDAFTISYRGRDPETVMKVTNRIAGLFIEDNLRSREEFIAGTSEFLDNELDEVKKNLESQEDAIRKFRQKYMGELPEQTGANLRKLDRLQLELQGYDDALSRARERRSILMDKSRWAGGNSSVENPEAGASRPWGEMGIARLEAELLDLSKKYTEKHPDIVQLKAEIAFLKGIEEEGAPMNEPGPGHAENSEGGSGIYSGSKYLGGIESSEEFRHLELEIQQVSAKRKKIKEQIEYFEEKVDNAPLREQTMLTLKRDYENTKGHYQSLLSKKLNASISENLEKRQKGEKFRIIDSANFPIKPFSPNPLKIILLGFMAGGSLGGGMAYLRELMDTSFKNVEEVQAAFRFPVLASIPNLKKM